MLVKVSLFFMLTMVALAGTDRREWPVGKVLDLISSQNSGYIESSDRTSSKPITTQDTDVTIAGTGFTYFAEDSYVTGGSVDPAGLAAASNKHGCRFVIGDDIKYSAYGKTLIVIDADGKECKLDVLRHVRQPKKH